MMFLVLEIQSTQHLDDCSQLSAWVNVSNQQDALLTLSEELSTQGWAITNIVECTKTLQDDYFPPCKSLDAFNEACEHHLALRFAAV